MSDFTSTNDARGVASGTAASGRLVEALRSLFGRIGDTFAALETAVRQSHAYETLSRMSDSELARRGLTRQDIARHVCDEVR